MEHLRWERRPALRRPVLIAAFEGWNDAGDAASTAVGWLSREWGGRRFASLDPEEFYDFTATRPQVRMEGGTTRRLEWPANTFSAATVPSSPHDVVLLQGVEPQLKWRTFCAGVLEVASVLSVEMVVTVGALLADVPHTRPVRITGTSHDTEMSARLNLQQSTYEGPTGILGVLHDACTTAGIPSASLWAAVPHYVHQVASPKAALALVERSAGLLGARVDAEDLRAAAEEYVREVSERVADDDDATAYVASLEEADTLGDVDPLTPPSGDVLAAEVERFLREHRRE